MHSTARAAAVPENPQERHAEMVAAVLKLRLRQGGVCLVAIAIRDEVRRSALQD